MEFGAQILIKVSQLKVGNIKITQVKHDETMPCKEHLVRITSVSMIWKRSGPAKARMLGPKYMVR